MQFTAEHEALRASVAAHWQARGRTSHLLMSFHGIPERYCQQGDPYFRRCHASARLLADELLLYIGPRLLGPGARYLIDLPEVVALKDAPTFTLLESHQFGEDLRLRLAPRSA